MAGRRAGARDWRARHPGPHRLRRRRRAAAAAAFTADAIVDNLDWRGRAGSCVMSNERLARSRSRASATRRVLVVGDIIADEFIYGQIARVSREAPVLILKYDATEMVAGGGGNAANNVAALGGRARLAGIVGRDAEGPAARVQPAARRRAHAHRPRAAVSDAGEDAHPGRRHPFGQAAGRADRSRDGLAARRKRSAARSRRSWSAAVGDCDAVILSDYGSGLVTPALAERMRRALARADRGVVRCRSSSTPATACSSIRA